ARPAAPRATIRSWIAIEIRGRVAAFEPNLVAAQVAELHEEGEVSLHSPILVDIELDHPAIDSLGIELLIPGGVQGVGEIHTPAVAADLHHLRRAVERSLRICRMRSTAHDAAQMYRARFLRLEWIGDVVMNNFARAPARGIQITIINRQVDVGE